MRHRLIFLFIFLCGSLGYAQNYRLESITVADGLSQGLVLSLFEDRRGFVWIGTFNGLNRYDGYQVKRFTPDHPSPWSLKANFIYCIAEDGHGLLWLGTDKGLAVMDPYTERFVLLSEINPSFPTGEVLHLQVKADGQVWFYYRQTPENGVYVVRPPADLLHFIREEQVNGQAFQIRSVKLPADLPGPLMWLETTDSSDITTVDQQGRFYRIHATNLQMQTVDLRTLNYQRWGKYGLVYAQQKTCGFAFPLPGYQDGTIPALTSFIQPPGEMPLIYRIGDSILYQLDTTSAQLKTVVMEDPTFFAQFKPFMQIDKGGLTYSKMVDRAGNIWVSTTGYGARKISRRKLDFKQYSSKQSFYNFTRLPDGRIWPGSHISHRVFNPHTGQLEPAPWVESLTKAVWTNGLLITRSGNWWMAASREEQLTVLTKSATGSTWQEVPVAMKFASDIAIPLLEDQQGNIWIAGLQGQLVRIRANDHRVDTWQMDQYFPRHLTRDLHSTCLMEDKGGSLWIGYKYGLVRVAHPNNQPVFQAWHNYNQKPGPLNGDWVLSLCPDPNDEQLIWVGMRGGLNGFNGQTGTCESFTETQGLADNVVYGILPDAFGYLWLSTNRGLSRFNPRNRTFSNFPNAEPKLSTEFNTGASQLLSSGELAFGSVEGLFVIHPLPERRTKSLSIVEVTQLKINGTLLEPNLAKSGWSFTAKNEISLDLPFDQNNIIFEFAALQIQEPAAAQYRYRVLGLGDHWILTGSLHTANLVAIPPGNYIIELQSIGANGNWASAPITRMYVHVQPPWYLSWPAWIIYGVLVLVLLFAYHHYEQRNQQLKHAGENSQREMERLKALDDFKNRFFGYISHEFKTPLTIIMGQAKRLPNEHKPVEVAKNAGTILHQSQSMLEMVDQMVDITRLDNQELRLNWRYGNFSDYVRYLVESLRSLADFKAIRLDFHSAVPDLMMDFDPLRLKYIVNNLLGNAVRHTLAGGLIRVSIHASAPDEVRMDILDTGKGIAPEDMPNIFDRYYRGSTLKPPSWGDGGLHHFGLGLAFVKDLLQLFAGSIAVSSRLGRGTIFTISLPVTRKAPPLETSFSELVIPQYEISNQPVGKSQKSLPLLLIVEDNPFISKFLQSSLSANFVLEFALDGLAGYEKALKIIPDLILTDVMMPRMDGHELTQKLKSHALTGHIPIVMLSARSGLSDRLTGQQLGADAYIGKPFDEQELILILQNLHRLQHCWRERYAGLTTQTSLVAEQLVEEIPEQPAEIVRQTDAFMLKIYALFEKNYANEDYDLLQLCRDLEMSKSQLHRKLSALSDQSAMQLLRRYRLQKAYDILSDHLDYNVNEICFQVGFKDRSHFSRLFSKTFSVAPSEVKKRELPGV